MHAAWGSEEGTTQKRDSCHYSQFLPLLLLLLLPLQTLVGCITIRAGVEVITRVAFHTLPLNQLMMRNFDETTSLCQN
jgi:hypothetical protein